MRMSRPARRALFDRHAYAGMPAALVVVLLIISAITGPSLFTSSGAASALANVAPLIMATLALTAVAIAGRGGVDLSIGPLISLINVTVVQWLLVKGVTNPVLVIAFAIAIGIAFELALGLLIALLRLQPIIVSLAGYLVLSGVDLAIMSQPGGQTPGWLTGWGSPTSIISPVLGIVVIALVVWTLIARTTFFRNIRMAGSNERTAYASGVSLLAARLGAHAIAGAFAGLGGVLYTALIASGDPTFGQQYTLMVVTALLLGGVSIAGGRGGALGATLGALSVYLISYVLSTFNFGGSSSFVVEMAYGLVLVGSLGFSVFAGLLRTRARRLPQTAEVPANVEVSAT